MTMEPFRVALFCLLIARCIGFATRNNAFSVKCQRETNTALNLVPIQNFRSNCEFLNESDEDRYCFDRNGTLQLGDGETRPYQLCLVEGEFIV